MSVFHFQQFSVRQAQSGMKVCTDAVLFGAMAPIKPNDRVLDIGAGTGVLSLMLAQLGASQVTAVELTEAAYAEALFNFQQSRWADQLEIVHQSIQEFALTAGGGYDLIICNPPFFEDHFKTAELLRKTARHTDQLAFVDLIACADKLLSPKGLFYVLMPLSNLAKFVGLARYAGLNLSQQIDYRAYGHSHAKVSALLFSRVETQASKQLLTIYDGPRIYTPQSASYLGEFLLRFAKSKD